MYQRYDKITATQLNISRDELDPLTKEIDMLEQRALTLQTCITEIEEKNAGI